MTKPKAKAPAAAPAPKARAPRSTGGGHMTPGQFFTAYHVYAERASHQTGWSRWAILAQWALETGWGSSALAGHNNLAGIRWYGRPDQIEHIGGTAGEPGTGFAGYRSLLAFVQDYVYVANLPYYRAVKTFAEPHDTAVHTIIPQLQALGRSPWSGQHYGNPPGANLVRVWRQLAPVAASLHAGHGVPA